MYAHYSSIIDNYVILIEDILVNTPFTIPIYKESDIDKYIAEYDINEFQGILIWSQKPITTTNEILLNNYQQFLSDNYSSLSNKLPGVFIIPQFGTLKGKFTGDFTILINFDFNIDRDMYGYWQKTIINDFISKHEFILNMKNYQLIPGYSVYPLFSEISQPIKTSTVSIFLRRSVIINVKYCNLFYRY